MVAKYASLCVKPNRRECESRKKEKKQHTIRKYNRKIPILSLAERSLDTEIISILHYKLKSEYFSFLYTCVCYCSNTEKETEITRFIERNVSENLREKRENVTIASKREKLS